MAPEARSPKENDDGMARPVFERRQSVDEMFMEKGSGLLDGITDGIQPLASHVKPIYAWPLWMLILGGINEYIHPWAFAVFVYGGSFYLLPFAEDKAALVIGIIHALCHVYLPFLDRDTGFKSDIIQWPDLIIHFVMQLWWNYNVQPFQKENKWIKTFGNFVLVGSILNLLASLVGHWNHIALFLFTWLSFFPTLSTGLFASELVSKGTGYRKEVYTFIMAFTVAIFIFLKYEDPAESKLLKFLSIIRFFETYFLIPTWLSFGYKKRSKKD